MKNYFILIALVHCTIVNNAQTGNINSSIPVNNPIFLAGARSFQNVLNVTGVSADAQTITICFLDSQGIVIDSNVATQSGNVWVDTINMDTLNNAAVSAEARYYDSTGTFLDVSNSYSFTIKPQPSSVGNGTVQIIIDSISANGVAYSRFIIGISDFTATISDSIVGIGGKSFGITKQAIVLDALYDLNTGSASVDSNIYQYQLIAFDELIKQGAFGLDTSLFKISLDAYLNPDIEGHFKASRDLFNYSSRDATIPLPITPASISVGAELSVKGGIAADCYLGMDTANNFGFIQSAQGQPSSISIGANITGNLRVTGSLFSKHLAGIRASLEAVGRIAATYQFQTVPQNQSTLLFGGDLLIQGKVELTGLAGKVKSAFCNWSPLMDCQPDNSILDGVIWPFNNGGTPRTFGSGFPGSLDSLLHTLPVYYNPYARGNQLDSNYLLNVPDQNPQPAFASRGAETGVAWIEGDSISNHLLFSVLDSAVSKFSPALEISENDVMLADPQATFAPDGSAIIVWSQSSFAAAEINNSMDIDTILSSLQVWYAVYDPQSNSITTKSKIYDANGSEIPSSKPTITISDSGKAIITWLGQDNTGTTDIWYCLLTNSNGIWYQSTPGMIYDEPGNNYSVQVCFLDSSNAIAAWISDPDATDSTGGNQIVFSSFNANGWSLPVSVTSGEPNTTFNEISIDFNTNAGYGVLAYTSTTEVDTGSQLNQIAVAVFHNGQWITAQGYNYADSTKSIRIPKVSVSDLGYAAVSYQAIDLYQDTSGQTDAGNVNILLNNLTNGTSNWQSFDFSTNIAQDTTVFVWDMDVMLSKNNMLYALSQEQDTIVHQLTGTLYTPHTGVLFGNPDMNLVLRGLKVNDDLSVTADSTSTLPVTPTGIKEGQTISNISFLAYPNPFRDKLVIEFNTNPGSNASVEIFNIMGQRVNVPFNRNEVGNKNKLLVDLNELAVGIYILKLSTCNQIRVLKLIKQ